MGQKTHPKGFRLGITENWDSRWFSKQDYARMLHQDLRIREFIRTQCAVSGMTVILTTHDLSDIEELCSRVLMIDAGRIIYDGELRSLKEGVDASRRLLLETIFPVKLSGLADLLITGPDTFFTEAKVSIITRLTGIIHYTLDGSDPRLPE